MFSYVRRSVVNSAFKWGSVLFLVVQEGLVCSAVGEEMMNVYV